MAIRRVKIPTITTTGSDGSATGTGTSPVISGRILAVHIAYSTGQENTTDVTLATIETPVQTVLVKANSDTNTWYFPLVAASNAADGAAITYDGTRPIYVSQPISDQVKATIGGADSGETIDITILYEE